MNLHEGPEATLTKHPKRVETDEKGRIGKKEDRKGAGMNNVAPD